MAFSDAVPQWTLSMAAGSLQQWTFTLTSPAPASSPPYPISGATWEYVVRATATTGGSPVFSITTTPSASGLITVTSSASLSQVLLAIYPAATATLGNTFAYAHALWMNPGTSTALPVFAGLLNITGAAQP